VCAAGVGVCDREREMFGEGDDAQHLAAWPDMCAARAAPVLGADCVSLQVSPPPRKGPNGNGKKVDFFAEIVDFE